MQGWTRIAAGLALAVAAGGTGATETLSDRSGRHGEVIREARVDAGNEMRGLMVIEQADRPCVVQIYGDLVPIRSYEGRIDTCKGGGPTEADGIDSTKGQVFLSGGASYVTGLRVCLSSSDRVKGWTLFGRSAASPNTVSESFHRPNCPGDGWQDRVDCPAGSKAIGVRAHFEAGSGNNSDMLRGMQLSCEG